MITTPQCFSFVNTYSERCFSVTDVAVMHPHKTKRTEFPNKGKTHQDSSFEQANKLKKPCLYRCSISNRTPKSACFLFFLFLVFASF